VVVVRPAKTNIRCIGLQHVLSDANGVAIRTDEFGFLIKDWAILLFAA